MSLRTSGRLWDGSTAQDVTQLARRFEADWRRSPGRGPDPSGYLPADPGLRPAALGELLRVDLSLRWEAGERVRAEWYQDRYPDLDGDALVALLYEEYCLREE